MDSYFRADWRDVPFDQFAQDGDAVQRTGVHVRLKPPLLFLGIYPARACHCALRAAAAGELLVLRYFLRRLSRSGRVHRGGSAARSWPVARRVSRIWTKVAHSYREELGELYKDQKQFEKAREAFTNAIAARSDSVYTFYYRAQASLGLNDFAAAIPDLERVVGSDRKFDYWRAAGLLADAYAQTGQLERAGQLYVDVAQFSTTTETLYNYAYFLKLAGRREESREWAEKLLAKKRTLPRYMQRYERPWFRKGK